MSSQDSTLKHTSPLRSPRRSIGVWLSLFLVVYILFNAVRAVLNPTAFADFFGLPLVTGNSGFVLVYAIRALFLGLFGLALILRKDFAALSVFVLVAAVMPLGDAVLVAYEAGPFSTVARHLLTAVFLFVTWFLLRHWLRSTATN